MPTYRLLNSQTLCLFGDLLFFFTDNLLSDWLSSFARELEAAKKRGLRAATLPLL